MRTMPDLQVTIRYRDRAHVLRFAAEPGATLVVGRSELQAWFGLPPDSLRNISRGHFRIAFDNGRFWIDELSRYGTYVRSLDAPTPLPYKRRRRARLAPGRQTELKLLNTNPTDGSADDLYVLIDNPGASDTLAVFADPLWDRLLVRLAGARAAHLLGLPGSGKWFLARQLMADDSRDRERLLGVSVLPVSVDGRALADDEVALWQAFARRLLLALGEAADRAGHAESGRHIAALVAQFDARPPGRPDESMIYFRRAFETLVNDALQSPLLLLTQFDSVYSELEPEMLYCLARFLKEWHEVSERIYLVIATTRPLGRLRDDAQGEGDAADFVREFNHLFDDDPVLLNYGGQFRALWASLTDGRPLDLRTEEALLALTGANPGLLRDVIQRLQGRGWLDDPAWLREQLAAEPWADAPLPTADKIWRALRPDERDCLVALAEGRSIDINRQQELVRLGLVSPEGAIFSDIFAATVARFRAEEDRHERGLRVDAPNRRVYVDGQPAALRDGREMDVLLALYAQRGRVVPYRELIEQVYGEPGVAYDEAMLFSDKEALQRAVGRLCDRIDPQRAYLTTKHGVGYCLSAAVG